MEINDVIYEAYKGKNGMFPFNDNYVLVNKSISSFSGDFDKYVANVKLAIQMGLNTCDIEDYRFYPDSEFPFRNMEGQVVYKTIRGLFIEEKAKGKAFGFSNIFLKEEQTNIDFDKVAINYLNFVNKYINELELRANAPQEVYDKLIRDILSFKKYNLDISPDPSYFFYNPDKGFIITNLVEKGFSLVKEENFVYYLIPIIMGYGKPAIRIGRMAVTEIPKELNDKYENILKVLSERISQALINNKLESEVPKVDFEIERKALRSDTNVEAQDMSNHIATVFAESKKLNEKMRVNGKKN